MDGGCLIILIFLQWCSAEGGPTGWALNNAIHSGITGRAGTTVEDLRWICTSSSENVLHLDFDHSLWIPSTDPAIRTANFMSKLLANANGSLDAFPDELFYALVRNNVHGNTSIFGSAIAFEPEVFGNHRLFGPYACKKNGSINALDLAANYNYTDPTSEWYYIPKTTLRTDISVLTDIILGNNDIQPEKFVSQPVVSLIDGYWTYPYFDCGGGEIWMVTYSSPIFFRSFDNDSIAFKGAATIDIDMTDLDINQCDKDSATGNNYQTKIDLFRGTHLCQETTKCEKIAGKGFTTGAYMCVCLPRYYFPDKNAEIKAFSGKDLETYYRSETSTENPEGNLFRCMPCARGCETCVDDSPCLYQSSDSLRLTMMALILLNITIMCCLSVATFIYRKVLVIKTASPAFLQLMCLGGVLMCVEFFTLYPEISVVVCSIRIWLWHVGFTVMYGSLIIKTWRISVIFTAGAQKRVKLPDQALFKRFAFIFVVAICIILGWNFASPPYIDVLVPDDRLKAFICMYSVWEFAVLGVEDLFLLYGGYLCFTVRKAPAHFNESKHITWSIYNAVILGTFMAVMLRLILASAGPDMLYILKFLQIQVYASVTLVLIFAPKFRAIYKKVEMTSSMTHATPATANNTIITITGRVKKSKVFPQQDIIGEKEMCSIGVQTSNE